MRQTKRIFKVLLVLCGLWLAFAFGLAVYVYAYGGTNQAQNADVIIVLGSGLRRDGSAGDALWRRSRWASQVWQNGFAPNIICTGGVSQGQRRSEASACKELLMNFGVPESAVYLEETSRSTEENAMNARAIMQANSWTDSIIVTDSFHAFRAHWIFNDQQVVNYPSPVPRDWVRATWSIRFVSREVIALHWQVVKELLNLPYTYVPIG